MRQVVYIVDSMERARQICEALEKEYIETWIVEQGKMVQILVEETDIEDAGEVIRGVLC